MIDELKRIVLNKYFGIGLGSVLISVVSIKLYLKRKKQLKKLAYPRDVVILHQFPRGLHAPSASPYAMKLETWLRMADIKYQNEMGIEFGPKGKVPWITYNGRDVADSQFCIEYLANELNKDLSKDFSLKDQALARACMKMTEESLTWCIGLHRYIFGPNPDECGIPKPFLMLYAGKMKKAAFYHGYGRHSKEEVYSIAKKDLKSINDILDGRTYLLGDKVCNEDAALFSIICQIVYHEKGPLHQFIMNECKNIVRYVEKIKQTYWPDWNDCITFKQAKKDQ